MVGSCEVGPTVAIDGYSSADPVRLHLRCRFGCAQGSHRKYLVYMLAFRACDGALELLSRPHGPYRHPRREFVTKIMAVAVHAYFELTEESSCVIDTLTISANPTAAELDQAPPPMLLVLKQSIRDSCAVATIGRPDQYGSILESHHGGH